MIESKSYLAWIETRDWCRANPGKKAAIASPQGILTVMFTPAEKSGEPQAEASETEILAVLRALSERHEWHEGFGRCVCPQHEAARKLLAVQPLPPVEPEEP